MSRYRNALPQLAGDFFLADAGIETDLIFNKGIEIREFAAHTLLPERGGREALAEYFRQFLALAGEMDAGFILDSQTWKAHMHWAADLGATENQLRDANRQSIDFIAALREEFSGNAKPIVLNAVVGPRGDAYAPAAEHAANEAEEYHARQLEWLAETNADMVTATTFVDPNEAAGFVRAAAEAGLPSVVSFTVETNGTLPTGPSLADAIRSVDEQTHAAAAYYMVNCAHPDHFFHVFDGADWTKRIRGVRCNASRCSHEELDNSETLDDGDPAELGSQYAELFQRMPWLNVFGGCCGSDFRHVREIAKALRG